MGAEWLTLLEPFAKWGAIALGAVGGLLLVVWLIRFWIRQAAKDEIRLEDFENAEKERQDFKERLRETRRRMRDAGRRGWLRDRKRGDDSAT